MILISNAIRKTLILVNTLPENNTELTHVAYCVNKHYTRGAGISIYSLLKHHKNTAFHIHIFLNHLKKNESKKFKQLAYSHKLIITIYFINHKFAKTLPLTERYKENIYYRLLIPSALSRYTKKVIYFDADTLIIGNCSSIFLFNIEKYTIAACNDTLRARLKQCNKLKLKNKNYFNSGMMLINVPRWIKTKVTERIFKLLLKKGKTFLFPDQDALNILLENTVYILPNQYNYIYDIIAHKIHHKTILPKNTMIIHYTGKYKPWHAWGGGNISLIYSKYYQSSPWASQPLDLPSHYKEMKRFAFVKWYQKDYTSSFVWIINYIKYKFLKKKKKNENKKDFK